MSGNNTLITTVRSLNGLINHELAEIDASLTQILSLSTDANDKMFDAVDRTTELFDGVGDMAGELERMGGGSELAEYSDRLHGHYEEFLTFQGQMARSMQTQDMLQQLIAHCRNKLVQIEQIGQDVHKLVDSDELDTVTAISLMNEMLINVASMTVPEVRAVTQRDVEEGDIEFF